MLFAGSHNYSAGQVGGLALELATWRASFWTLAIISATFTVVAWWTIPYDSEQTLDCSYTQKFRQFDVLGASLAATGIASLTASLTLAGQASHGWRTPYIAALFAAGIIFVAIFLFWESVFTYPLMPLSIWKDRNFTLLVITLCLCFYGFAGNLVWLCLLWQRIQHNSPLMVDAKLLPAAISAVCVNLIVALTMHRVDNKVLMAVGTAGFVVSNALLSATSEQISYWALTFPALILITVGADFQFTVTNVYVLSCIPTEQQSVGGGILITMSKVASTIGLGVQTSTFTALGGSSSGPGAIKYRAYQSTFWVSLAGSVLALMFLPFITVGSQGARVEKTSDTISREAQGVEDRTT